MKEVEDFTHIIDILNKYNVSNEDTEYILDYILKEDEERFKDILWLLKDVGFVLMRYERRGLYYLKRNDEYIKVFVLHKISSEVRHTGSTDFRHEKIFTKHCQMGF